MEGIDFCYKKEKESETFNRVASVGFLQWVGSTNRGGSLFGRVKFDPDKEATWLNYMLLTH